MNAIIGKRHKQRTHGRVLDLLTDPDRFSTKNDEVETLPGTQADMTGGHVDITVIGHGKRRKSREQTFSPEIRSGAGDSRSQG